MKNPKHSALEKKMGGSMEQDEQKVKGVKPKMGSPKKHAHHDSYISADTRECNVCGRVEKDQ